MNMLSAVTGRHGIFVHDDRDECIGRSLRTYGEWAEEEIYLLSELVRPGDTIVDIGANIGTHTIAFSRMVGPAGRVLSIDGQSIASALLALNIALNKSENVQRIEGLVGQTTQVVFVPEEVVDRSNIGAVAFKHLINMSSAPTDRMRPLAMFTVDSI